MKHEALDHHAASDCPNCGADVSGNFCHQCGQETVLHPPSTREFLHEFIGHYVALEGKLWQTLRLLLLKPGQLTLEYMAGRRVRYVQPLRVYLTFSVIFFAVLKFTDHGDKEIIRTGPVKEQAAGKQHGSGHAPAPAKKGGSKDGETADGEIADGDAGRTGDGKVAVINEDKPGEFREGTRDVRAVVNDVSPYLGDKFGHFVDLPQAERERVLRAAFYGYAPYAIFLLMPLFALYLKVLYLGSGRRYGEHLLFALHTNAFAFLMMALMRLVPNGFGLVTFALWIWLALYLPKAMRRVYGGGRVLTVLRWAVLMCFHWLSIGAALLLAVAFGVLH
ncbi:DUF3667 domain-containing protein [Massilia sp. TN1-12]|uniref:DUF3667 domain-containing protein n=1 Tax=Massilia paldalensis TaxID=3377675 RepID=UPI00384B27B0